VLWSGYALQSPVQIFVPQRQHAMVVRFAPTSPGKKTQTTKRIYKRERYVAIASPFALLFQRTSRVKCFNKRKAVNRKSFHDQIEPVIK
jgi:hypothetical protein